MTKQPRKPAQVLLEARQKASREKRAKVLAVVDEMKSKGEPVTFLAVAKGAGVSNWLVYAEGVREHIEAARNAQGRVQANDRRGGGAATSASLSTDLELARVEVRSLREERDRLKAAVQRGLGQQVAQAGQADLVARIDELTAANQGLADQLAQAEAHRHSLQAVLTETQDDLAAARTALRNMMREQNRPME
ncbi:DUF6262 family protein [Streptomyces bacillaris]